MLLVELAIIIIRFTILVLISIINEVGLVELSMKFKS